MQLRDMLKSRSRWMGEAGPDADVVITSRIRIARNLAGQPFPHRAQPKQQREILAQVLEAVKRVDMLKDARFLDVGKLDRIDRRFLVERHLISLEHAERDGERGLVYGSREMVSLMINEEDHLRLQGLLGGLALRDIWGYLKVIERRLGEHLDYAYHDRYGFLTACPTNVGTGIRVSSLVHLPALVLTGEINKVLPAATKVGIVSRGLYGEGTRVMGDIFQLSNVVTLGKTEDEVIDAVQRVVTQIIDYEREGRKALLKGNRTQVEDRVYRAYAMLIHARTISFEETMDHLSKVRLGLHMGLDLGCDLATINELMIITQPAHIQEAAGKELTAEQRDQSRADLQRTRLRPPGRGKVARPA